MVSFSGVEWWGDELSVTVSMGGAAAGHDDTVELLVARAQFALGQSQAEGGDRVIVLSGDENHSLKV
jgi:c-di-AMP phosphodiesterase-like protein